jgi:alkaline phosphatase
MEINKTDMTLKLSMRTLLSLLSTLLVLGPVLALPSAAQETGDVIFFHPDGMGVNQWGAVRMRYVGPDGRLNWDSLPHLAVYTGHMANTLTATSHGGATVHAYGVKVKADSYGLDERAPITSRAGNGMSIFQQAKAAGRAVGLVNSGTITEPGTGVFAASVPRRTNHADIARLILELEPDVILGGGERYFLPEGIQGVHGEGRRQDGLNLIARARDLGYTVIFSRAELEALPPETDKLLGLFAAHHTFNAAAEEALERTGRAFYEEDAPSIAEMVSAALAILSRKPDGFLLVAEEEGTDNFGNANNAGGTLEAGRRADEAVGVIREYIRANPKTLMIMTSDSDAGGMQVVGRPPGDAVADGQPLPERDPNGAPFDGVSGTGSQPFLSAPDRAGQRWPFAIAWASRDDVSGGILVRAEGLNAELVHGTLDSTDVYRVIYRTLFGVLLD